MITVEELIVQSLYHRLVLIKVRRTPQPRTNSGDDDRGPDDSASSGVLQTVGSRSALSNEAAASPEGLGKQLHINASISVGLGWRNDSKINFWMLLAFSGALYVKRPPAPPPAAPTHYP